MEKKTSELQQAIELAENTHRLIVELQNRTVTHDNISPRQVRPSRVLDDQTASDLIQRARHIRQEFYLSEEKSSERQYTYTEEEDSERDDARNEDSDHVDEEEDNTDSQVSDIADSQQPGEFSNCGTWVGNADIL
jgi:hypothetical protein